MICKRFLEENGEEKRWRREQEQTRTLSDPNAGLAPMKGDKEQRIVWEGLQTSVILRVLVRKGVSPGKDCLLEESHTGRKWLSKYPHHTQSLVGATKRKIAFL